jgi:hypothetical protein
MIILFRNFYTLRYVLKTLKPLLFVSIGIQISFFIISAIIGHSAFHFLTILPLSSPVIHSSFSHFFQNFLMLFFFLLPTVNIAYNANYLLKIAFLLSLLYLPFVLLGFSDPVIGLSGLGYFLMSRFVLSNQSFRKLVIAFFVLIIIGELSLLGSSDDIAHGFHLFSAGCGVLTVTQTKILRHVTGFVSQIL